MGMEFQIEKGISFAEQYLEVLERMFPQFTKFGIIGVLVGLVIGLLFTFFGYRLIRFLLAAIGFIVGLGLGGDVAIRLSLEDDLIVIISFVMAVVMAFAAGFIYKLGLFIVFTAAGYYFGGMLLPLIYHGSRIKLLVLAFAILCGILSAFLGRMCIIAGSSFAGGLAVSHILISQVLTQVAQLNSTRTTTIMVLVLGFILAAVAMRYQITTTEGD